LAKGDSALGYQDLRNKVFHGRTAYRFDAAWKSFHLGRRPAPRLQCAAGVRQNTSPSESVNKVAFFLRNPQFAGVKYGLHRSAGFRVKYAFD